LRDRQHRRQDATIRPDAEELLSAGIATICGNKEQTPEKQQRAFSNPIASDALEIKIPAPGTVRIASERERHAFRVETEIAGMAAPRAQHGQAAEKVRDAGATRAVTIRAAALRANHSTDRLPLRRQGKYYYDS
jgi:hypothetical protein